MEVLMYDECTLASRGWGKNDWLPGWSLHGGDLYDGLKWLIYLGNVIAQGMFLRSGMKFD